MLKQQATGGALELAVLLLGGLVLLRVLVGMATDAFARGTGCLAAAARRTARALRPGLARRLTAAALGLGAPAASLLPPASAASTPWTDPAPDRPATALGVASLAGAPQPTAYLVRPGDTLWDIARRHLPAGASAAQVARAWPRWYAANRRVIGPDPSLIVPGQRLLVPGRRSAGTPTQPHAAPAPSTGTPVPSALSLDPDRR